MRPFYTSPGVRCSSRNLSATETKYSSAGVALRDIKVMANRWTAFHKVWYIGLRKLPMADQNETMLQEINSAKEGLESVRDDVREALKQVGAIERRVKSKLSAGSSISRTGIAAVFNFGVTVLLKLLIGFTLVNCFSFDCMIKITARTTPSPTPKTIAIKVSFFIFLKRFEE